LTLVLMAAVGGVAIVSLGSVSAGGVAMYDQAFLPVTQLDKIAQAVLDEGRLVNKGIVQIGNADGQAAIDTSIAADEATLAASLAAYRESGLSDEEATILADVQAAYADYGPLRASTRQATLAGDRDGATSASNAASTARTKMQTGVAQLVQLHDARARALSDANTSTAGFANLILLAGLLVALLVGFGLSFLIARRITRGVAAVQGHLAAMRVAVGSFSTCVARLAENDLSAEYNANVEFLAYTSGDEIGATATLSNELLSELKAMVGNYETARANLTATLGEVKDAADGVARTSKELTAAAHQSGQASGQIAATINQVAGGAQDQAMAASTTSGAVQELGAVIGQVGSGAAETTRQVAASAAAVTRLASAIEAASSASAEVSSVST
jgi:methyl-accepting chemotaxis protein